MDYFLDVVQIVFADIILSGDNALVIGMAAASLPLMLRRRAIMLGMALAAGLRIFFAAIATHLLAIPGILFFGGLLLLIVCWRFFNELRAQGAPEDASADDNSGSKTLWAALITITIADVSMSIDNVVAVAAIAREDTNLLIFGLVLAIAFMALFATMIMRVMTKYPFLAWAGLVFLVYLSGDMLFDGWPEFKMLVGI